MMPTNYNLNKAYPYNTVIFALYFTVRFPYARDFPFNNVGTAFVTLFELLTLEGWTEIRDMFSGRNKMAEAVSDRHMNTKKYDETSMEVLFVVYKKNI